MAKRKSKTIKLCEEKVTRRIEVVSDNYQEFYRLLGGALFEKFSTSATFSRTYADEDCVHFEIKVNLRDREKLQNSILKFCRQYRIGLLQDNRQ